jgi:1-deoxy-D-xylulose-5-phosphate reductoisomerase
MSVPDMRLCVQYALSSPQRYEAVIDELDFSRLTSISFGKADTETFVLLGTALDCLSMGGGMGAVLNAANEIAVSAFLSEKIGFTDIFDCVTDTVAALSEMKNVHDLEGVLNADKEARVFAASYVNKIKRK